MGAPCMWWAPCRQKQQMHHFFANRGLLSTTTETCLASDIGRDQASKTLAYTCTAAPCTPMGLSFSPRRHYTPNQKTSGSEHCG